LGFVVKESKVEVQFPCFRVRGEGVGLRVDSAGRRV